MSDRLHNATLARRRHRRRHRRAHPAPRLLRAADAHRLLWRAGMGPRPGDVERMTGMTRVAAVRSLTRPAGAARLIGPEPHDGDGAALAPADRYGHDHLWWLDRMVRSDQPLVERMTLVLHDWFATSNDKVDNQQQMLDQNALLRRHALGSFADLFQAITIDPAMLIWLDGSGSAKDEPNENYAREMMELFSLGAERGAYTEQDIREQARALTGWTNDWSDQNGNHNFRFDPGGHDDGVKTIFGHSGAFDYRDAVRLCLEHPLHASWFAAKLWSYFVPVAPDRATLAALVAVYRSSGYSIRAVLELILSHDALYSGPSMTKPPVVLLAGMLRALRRGIDTTDWVDHADQTGQRLFEPPNVAGWPKDRWLDTSTFKGRWETAAAAIEPSAADPGGRHSATSPQVALANALRSLGRPLLGAQTSAYLLSFARACAPPAGGDAGNRSAALAWRHNALRQLILSSPDHQVA